MSYFTLIVNGNKNHSEYTMTPPNSDYNKAEIKVGILMAYDFTHIQTLLPTIYNFTDKITIGIDKQRLTWSGEHFTLDSSILDWISKFDTKNIITIIEEEFFIAGLSPMECENRARDFLTESLGVGGWHIQLDLDEYFVDFPGAIDYLYRLDHSIKYTIKAYLNTIFKKLDHGFLMISQPYEAFPFATNNPSKGCGRKWPNEDTIQSPFIVIHNSWGRTPHEIWEKIHNWGHSRDFQTEQYFRFWESISLDNYRYIHNFHPLYPLWSGLEYIEIENIEKLIDQLNGTIPPDIATQTLSKTAVVKRFLLQLLPPILLALYQKMKTTKSV